MHFGLEIIHYLALDLCQNVSISFGLATEVPIFYNGLYFEGRIGAWVAQ